ncbi:MAG TPA: serine--tRNA ligase, partial [Candidatus Woesebacteria bacterium]|nr:serine--tRNA ligase [Candidatus Woesebacteria bacterium]
MLDIAYIRQNAKEVKQACKNKQIDSGVVDQLLEVDEKRRSLQQKVDDLRRDSNEHARKLKQNVANGTLPTEADKELGKDFKNKLKELEPQLKEVEDKYQALLYQIPNVPAHDVPIGPDESGNQIIRQVGTAKTFNFEPKTHEELMIQQGWLD